NFYKLLDKRDRRSRRKGRRSRAARSYVRPGTTIVLGVGATERRFIMQRRISWGLAAVLGGVLLGFGVQQAVAEDNWLYKGTKCWEGSASCQAGVQFRCNDGEWKSVGVACSDNPVVAANCQFGGITYPNGTASCQGGNQYRCDSGAWTSLDAGCPAA